MRHLIRSVMLLMLIFPVTVWAIRLGEMRVMSSIGQPLNAQIIVSDASMFQAQDLEANLASAHAFDQLEMERPLFLEGLQFKISKRGANFVIRVYSHAPLSQNHLDFLLDFSWPTGRLLRRYSVILELHDGKLAKTLKISQISHKVKRPVLGTTHVRRRYGPTTSKDQLLTVAQQLRPSDKVTLAQTALAIYRSNPDAFEHSIDKLRQGVYLKAPTEQEAKSVDLHEASQRIWGRATVQKKIQHQRRHGAVIAEQKDNLLLIAKRVRPDTSVTIEQMAWALFKFNHTGFIGRNVNGLHVGQVLQIPLLADVKKVSADAAKQAIEQQNQAWLAQHPVAVPQPSALNSAQRAKASVSPSLESHTEHSVGQIGGQQQLVPVSLEHSAAQTKPSTKGMDTKTKSSQAVLTHAKKSSVVQKKVLSQGTTASVSTVETRKLRRSAVATPAVTNKSLIRKGVATAPWTLWAGLVLGLLLLAGVLFWWRQRRLDLALNRQAQEGREHDLQGFLQAKQTTTNTELQTEGADGSLMDVDAQESVQTSTQTVAPTVELSTSGAETSDLEVDSLEEALVFIAYERYTEAEDSLKQALANRPQRDDLKLALLEVYVATGDRTAYATLRRTLADDLAERDTTLAHKLSALDTAIATLTHDDTVATVIASEPEADETTNLESQTCVEAELGDEQHDDGMLSQQDETGLTELGEQLETDFVETEDGTLQDNTSGEEVDFLDQFVDKTMSPAETLSIDIAAASGSAHETEPKEQQGLDFEEGLGTDLQIKKRDLNQDRRVEGDDDGMDLNTKLDLAMAYVEIGDAEGARDLLEQIRSQGNDAQQAKAQAILDELNG